MRIRHRIKRAFTLVEILIVVVILGILAAIVIPQFTSASQQAEAASVASQLQTIRSQVELFQVQHGGDYPFDSSGSLSESDWEKLTKATPKEGTPTGEGPYGPYFEEVPENGLAPDDASNTGWHWDGDDTIKAIVADNPKEENAAVAAGLEEGTDWTNPSK
jgi:general secretion pathway protein G